MADSLHHRAAAAVVGNPIVAFLIVVIDVASLVFGVMRAWYSASIEDYKRKVENLQEQLEELIAEGYHAQVFVKFIDEAPMAKALQATQSLRL